MTSDGYTSIMNDIVFKLEDAGYSVGNKPASKKLKSGLDTSKMSPASLFNVPGQAGLRAESFFFYHDEGRSLLDVQAWLANSINYVTEVQEWINVEPSDVNLELVDAATDEWRATPEGNGHNAFYRFALALMRAGVQDAHIKGILTREAQHARSPADRKRQIVSIMKSLKKHRTGEGTDWTALTTSPVSGTPFLDHFVNHNGGRKGIY